MLCQIRNVKRFSLCIQPLATVSLLYKRRTQVITLRNASFLPHPFVNYALPQEEGRRLLGA